MFTSVELFSFEMDDPDMTRMLQEFVSVEIFAKIRMVDHK